MATPAQIAANRRNARRSTGPRTEAGRNTSRLNAIKHGLAASASVFLPHEDPLRYHEMRAALLETWQPVNAQELLLVDQICQAWWATERAARFQNGFFENQLRTMKARNGASERPHPGDDEGIAVSMSDPANDSGYRTLFRYDDRAWSKYYRAIDRLRKVQADRRKLEKSTPPAMEPDDVQSELASFGQNGESVLRASLPPVETTQAPAPPPDFFRTSTPVMPSSTLTVAQISSSE
jgi:hypothetical protein